MNFVKRNIPNFITCLNLGAGVMSIICSLHHGSELWGLQSWQWAYIFIAIAAAADFLDGFAARLLRAYSNLGKELDSLCDLVSFGVAPAIIMFNCLDWAAISMDSPQWTKWTVSLIPIFGALRLARFNLDDRQKDTFIGLPVPANAIFWIGFSALAYSGNSVMTQWYWFIPVLIAECWLMIAPVRMFSLKFKTWGWRGNQWRWLLILTAAVLVFCMGVPGLMWLVIAYVLYGIFDAKNQ